MGQRVDPAGQRYRVWAGCALGHLIPFNLGLCNVQPLSGFPRDQCCVIPRASRARLGWLWLLPALLAVPALGESTTGGNRHKLRPRKFHLTRGRTSLLLGQIAQRGVDSLLLETSEI